MAYNYFNPYGMQAIQPIQQAPAQQVQNNGCVYVRNEQEARNYPVAYGNSVTFKDENSNFLYVKTMGFSQADRPIFEKYAKVVETAQNVPEKTEKPKGDTDCTEKLKSEIGALWREIEALKKTAEEETGDGV